MTLEQFKAAIYSLQDWPGKIGIIGGEPTMHPQFTEFCDYLRAHVPREKLGLWTSGGISYQGYLPAIQQTFDMIAYNEHSKEQQAVCKHQPLTIAINEVVVDPLLRNELIDDCWVQRTWCPTINHFGAYFCEIAAAQDALLNEGKHAWPVTPNWWRKSPVNFQLEVAIFCGNCGMAIPMERELIKNRREKFSPKLLQTFRDLGLSRVSDKDVELVEGILTRDLIEQAKGSWAPGNYRGDLHTDDNAPEGLGSTK